MMKKAINFIVNDLNKSKIRLSGQAYLIDFYQNLGFKRVSEVYLEDGIDHYEFLYENNQLNLNYFININDGIDFNSDFMASVQLMGLNFMTISLLEFVIDIFVFIQVISLLVKYIQV